MYYIHALIVIAHLVKMRNCFLTFFLVHFKLIPTPPRLYFNCKRVAFV